MIHRRIGPPFYKHFLICKINVQSSTPGYNVLWQTLYMSSVNKNEQKVYPALYIWIETVQLQHNTILSQFAQLVTWMPMHIIRHLIQKKRSIHNSLCDSVLRASIAEWTKPL